MKKGNLRIQLSSGAIVSFLLIACVEFGSAKTPPPSTFQSPPNDLSYAASVPVRQLPTQRYSVRSTISRIDQFGNIYVARTMGTTFNQNAFETNGKLAVGVASLMVAKYLPDGKVAYSIMLGGSADDEVFDITYDRFGCLYLTGITDSNNFPIVNSFQGGRAGGTDAFILKISADGTKVLFSSYLGGMSNDWGLGIAIVDDSDIVVTGVTDSVNFPTTTGSIQTNYGGGPSDAFLTEISTAEKQDQPKIVYSTFLGGNGADAATAVIADASNNIYLTGFTRSSNLLNNVRLDNNSTRDSDAFLIKIGAQDFSVNYVNRIAGNRDDLGLALAVSKSGDIAVAGTTDSTDLATTENAFQKGFGGGSDAFVSVFDITGKQLLYSTYVGGLGFETGESVSFDPNGSIMLGGKLGRLNSKKTFNMVNSPNLRPEEQFFSIPLGTSVLNRNP